MAEYAALGTSAHGSEPRYSIARAHFRADVGSCEAVGAEGRTGLGGLEQPVAMEPKASYYSAVCLESVPVEWMELDGKLSNYWNLGSFLEQLREGHTGPLGDLGQRAGAPWRGGAGVLADTGLGLRLVNLPGYSPDFNADEAVWGWPEGRRRPGTFLGTKALDRMRVGLPPRAVHRKDVG